MRRKSPSSLLLGSLLLLPLLLFSPSLPPTAVSAAADDGGNNGGFLCDIPTKGCENGMFNRDKCACECIPPYCPYALEGGICTLPSGACGGNPWVDCTRGEDCPWWPNPLKDESCTTGPEVPVDTWVIYNTRRACCNTNFLYSEICDYTPEPEPVPTKHPTISEPEPDDFEVVPIKFDLLGVPDDARIRDLKDEMVTVLKRILLSLAERIADLRISDIEERADLSNRRRLRWLVQDVTLYFNVNIVRVDGKRFGPLIITEIRDSYDEFIEQIRTFTDTTYFGGDINLNLCTSEKGKFTTCVKEIPTPAPLPPPKVAPAPVVELYSEPEPEQGLEGWVVALIVLGCVVLLCCLGFAIFAACSPPREEGTSKEIHNNIYMDDGSRGGGSEYTGRDSRRSRRTTRTDDRSRRTTRTDDRSRRTTRTDDRSRLKIECDRQAYKDEEFQIVLAGPQSASVADDSFTINTRRTNETRRTNGTRRTNDTRRTNGTKKQGRDPTRFIPNQEDRPDPEESDIFMIADGDAASRRYDEHGEDPPLKPKRDPTMYVPGQSSVAGGDPPTRPSQEPSVYGEEEPSVYDDHDDPSSAYGDRSDPSDPSLYTEARQAADRSMYAEGLPRDPTMYVDGVGWYDSETTAQSRSVDPYSGFGEYDDPSSFATEELQSVSSQRSRKSKKGGRRSHR